MLRPGWDKRIYMTVLMDGCIWQGCQTNQVKLMIVNIILPLLSEYKQICMNGSS